MLHLQTPQCPHPHYTHIPSRYVYTHTDTQLAPTLQGRHTLKPEESQPLTPRGLLCKEHSQTLLADGRGTEHMRACPHNLLRMRVPSHFGNGGVVVIGEPGMGKGKVKVKDLVREMYERLKARVRHKNRETETKIQSHRGMDKETGPESKRGQGIRFLGFP